MAFFEVKNIVLSGVFLLVARYVLLAIYRLYLHPLAKFPGPKLAAVTHWYECYYDVIKRGTFIWQIEQLHEQYGMRVLLLINHPLFSLDFGHGSGIKAMHRQRKPPRLSFEADNAGPIIRINPDELHIKDSEYYDEIYGTTTRKRDKWAPWVAMQGTTGSIFATASHDLHRIRRTPLSPFFSKKKITELEPVIHDKVAKLMSRFETASKTGEIIRLDAAYTAFTMDLICSYAFGFDDNYLMEDDFKVEWRETIRAAFEGGAFVRQFPWSFHVLMSLPPWLLAAIQPSMKFMMDWRNDVRRRVSEIVRGRAQDRSSKFSSQRTIFDALLDSNLPPEEKQLDRLCDEAQTTTGAASETTAWTLSTTTFYLLQHRDTLEKLRQEIRTALPSPRSDASWAVLEQLPFLSAVISEGLRMSLGATTRLPRVAVDETLQYKEWHIPRGTPVSASTYFTLMNPDIFPDPASFKPERWILENGERNRQLDKYNIVFGRGTSSCLGINLAYCELFLVIATLFRRFDMELYETELDDVVMERDFFTASPKLDTKGIRLRVVGLVNE